MIYASLLLHLFTQQQQQQQKVVLPLERNMKTKDFLSMDNIFKMDQLTIFFTKFYCDFVLLCIINYDEYYLHITL